MRVQGIGQENKTSKGVLKAGAIGAAAGALVRNFAPLTKNEHDFFFNSSAVDGIAQKVKKVRVNEIEKIAKEFANGSLNVSKEAFDVFESHKSLIADEPKKVLDYIKDSGDSIKKGVKSLAERVDARGIAKQHIEVSDIKNAAKASRPIGFFIAMGTLAAMSGQVIANAVKACLPEKEEVAVKEPEALTMADVLLEGLGSNTEVLFLTNQKLIK